MRVPRIFSLVLAVIAVTVLPSVLRADPGEAPSTPAGAGIRFTPTPWEPPPPPRRPAGVPRGERTVVSIDRETGRIEERTFESAQGLLPERYTRAGVGIDALIEKPDDVRLQFSGWTRVLHPLWGEYPRRVKIVAHYTDAIGRHIISDCSGTLIDPKHVITAAHCIWSHEALGQPVNAYADSVVVIPAYENGGRPFGSAGHSQMHVWGNWVTDEDYDHDLGVIDLDRPIGGLAGWFGYGYDNGCDSWESSIWRHAGWPGEAPFDGELLYENAGAFDDCLQDGWDNRASWNGPTWGGTSGAGALKTTTGAIYAVFSTSDRSTVSVDCKVTETKFGHIGQMISEDWPPALDLVVMDVNGPATVTSGTRPSFLDFAVFNYSMAAQSGAWNYRVFLSTDDIITSADIQIGSASFTHAFGPNAGLRVAADVPPLVPAATPAGTYYLGVILDVADWNIANNASNGQEVGTIEVLCPDSSPPTLTTPPNGMTCTDRDVYFGWSAVAPLALYQIQIGTACGDGPIVETGATNHTAHGLAAGTTYYWRVRTRAQCGSWGSWTGCRWFRTEPNPSTVSTVVAPSDGAHCQSPQPVLRWTALPDAQTYDVQISPTWCYEGDITTGITGTSLATSGLLPNTTYYWRVRAHTSCGQTTAWSSAPGFCWTFKTAPTSLAPPVRMGPGDGTSCGAPSTALTWNHIDGKDHYEVQIGTSCGTGSIHSVTGNAYTPTGLQSGVTYYWRVRAFHECGLTSAWTSCWSFSLDLEPPTNPTSLTSTTHTPGVWNTTDNRVNVHWDWGWDNCAGSWPQYATLWDRSAATEPTEVTTAGEITLETSPPLADGNDHWFHVRTVDYAGNYALETLHLGPFWIDLSPPTAPAYDYATLDPGQIIGPTYLTIDWLPSADPTSGVTGYSYVLSGGATPPVTLDNVVDGTDLWHTVRVGKTGSNYFHVKAVNGAGSGGAALTHGSITVDPERFGAYFTAPDRGEVLDQGSVYRLRWDLYDPGPPVFVNSGRLDWSPDAGATWQTIANPLTPAQVTQEWFDWTVPAAASDEAVVRLRFTDIAGRLVQVRSVRFAMRELTAVDDVPSGFALEAARPNPFRHGTSIGFTMPSRAPARITVFDLTGKRVRSLIDDPDLPAGRHAIEWDGLDDHGRPVPAGVYLCRLDAGPNHAARRVVHLK